MGYGEGGNARDEKPDEYLGKQLGLQENVEYFRAKADEHSGAAGRQDTNDAEHQEAVRKARIKQRLDIATDEESQFATDCSGVIFGDHGENITKFDNQEGLQGTEESKE